MVIEIKTGNAGAGRALCGLLANEPALIQSVGVVMSFDLWLSEMLFIFILFFSAFFFPQHVTHFDV